MTTDDALDLIRSTDPRPDVAPDADRAARVDAALERLLAGESSPANVASRRAAPRAAGRALPRLRAAASAPDVAARRPARSLPRLRTAGAVLATAAACGAGLVVALPGAGTGGPGVESADAATVLREARAATLAPTGSGPWTTMISRSWRNQLFRLPGSERFGSVLVPYRTEQWVSDNGEQLIRQTRGDDWQFPVASERAAYEAGSDKLPDDPFDGKLIRLANEELGYWPTRAGVQALPTDPDALAAKLAGTSGGVVHYATAILGTPLPSTELRAALYTVLLRVPGARLEPALVDPDGRTGDGVRFITDERGGDDTTLLFDRETHALLAIRSINDQTERLGRVLTSWIDVVDLHRAEQAPKPDLEVRPRPGGAPHEPEYVPVP